VIVPPITTALIMLLTPIFRDMTETRFALASSLLSNFIATCVFFELAHLLRLKPTYIVLIAAYLSLLISADLPRLVFDQANIRSNSSSANYNPRVYRNMELGSLAGDAVGLVAATLLQGPLPFS